MLDYHIAVIACAAQPGHVALVIEQPSPRLRIHDLFALCTNVLGVHDGDVVTQYGELLIHQALEVIEALERNEVGPIHDDTDVAAAPSFESCESASGCVQHMGEVELPGDRDPHVLCRADNRIR